MSWRGCSSPRQEPLRDTTEALEHARDAVRSAPGEPVYLNTLGVALYRAGEPVRAIEALRQSLEAGQDRYAAFDLFFLAMAHHRLGHREEARRCFDGAELWMTEQKGLSGPAVAELTAFRAEARAVLAGAVAELPADVFAPD